MVGVEKLDGRGGKFLCANGLWIAGHYVLHDARTNISKAFDEPAEVAFSKDACYAVVFVDDGCHADVLFGDFANGLKHADPFAHGRNVIALTHDVLDMDEQASAESAARMASSEILLRKALGREGRDGKCVAERQCGSCGGGGGQIERTGFAFDVTVEMYVSMSCETGI